VLCWTASQTVARCLTVPQTDASQRCVKAFHKQLLTKWSSVLEHSTYSYLPSEVLETFQKQLFVGCFVWALHRQLLQSDVLEHSTNRKLLDACYVLAFHKQLTSLLLEPSTNSCLPSVVLEHSTNSCLPSVVLEHSTNSAYPVLCWSIQQTAVVRRTCSADSDNIPSFTQ
jgi:hypothetical protein